MNRQNGAITRQLSTNHGSNSSHNLHTNHHLNSTAAASSSLANGSGGGVGGSTSNNNSNNDHDYEDIYLVREEVRNHKPQSNLMALSSANGVASNATKIGRSRSRDSGSHSRSASASSNHSTDYVIQYGNVSFEGVLHCFLTHRMSPFQNKRVGSKQDLLQKGKGYDMLRNSASEAANSYTYNKRKEYYGSTSKLQNDTYESVCAPEDTEERTQAAQRNGNVMTNQAAAANNNQNRLLKRVVSAPVGMEMPKGELSEAFV